jgi:hypothetical protein
MLHSASHYTPIPVAEEIRLGPRDKDVLQRLAGQLADIAALPVHREKAQVPAATTVGVGGHGHGCGGEVRGGNMSDPSVKFH